MADGAAAGGLLTLRASQRQQVAQVVALADRADVAGVQGYVFSAGRDQKHQVLFTIYAYTGDNREELAASVGRFPLAKTDEVTYAACLGCVSIGRQLDQKTLISYFNFIREDWKTGEM